MPTRNKILQAKYYAKWYKNHKSQHIANVSKRNQRIVDENQRKIYDYLLAHPCVDCGESNPIVLDFDHDNPFTKTEAVTAMVSNAYSWETVNKEVKKCTIRCGNCHRIKTSRDGNYIRWRLWWEQRESNPQLSD